jgi:hypothetical protein
MGIKFTQSGGFDRTEAWLGRLKSRAQFAALAKYGAQGVAALSAATPVESGLTAQSWTFTITQRAGYYSIRWHNTHEEAGVPIAVMLQYGHGTGTGGYVQGRDYINPAIQPIFDQIAAEAWKVVTNG